MAVERERGNTTRHTQRPRARRVYSNEPCRYLSSEGDLSRYLVRSCCSIFLPRCLLIFSAVPLLVLLVPARLLTLPCLHRKKKRKVWFYWWRKSKVYIYMECRRTSPRLKNFNDGLFSRIGERSNILLTKNVELLLFIIFHSYLRKFQAF